ncbi:putative transporter SVOPL isoform X1 [Motacilla alba alba]|uniref:putative transporter SVOPL isoform X1 n=1 Tax=Motacilla alba alba TaxID=1094192 RepID=UPI0018D548C7|nr:putative transporter SVOPL isoform X1 [Motacilla alba alba]
MRVAAPRLAGGFSDNNGVFWLHGVQHSARAPGRSVRPLEDPAALLPLGSLFLPADLVCPIIHLVCVPAGHGRRWRVGPCARVRLCKPPSQRRLIIKTEFLPTKYRGYMLPLSQVFWLAGSLLIIGLASVVNPTMGWRWLIRIASIPGILLILVFRFIPESARYNVSTGNTAAALATLQRIARMNGAAMPEGQLREPAKERRGRFKDLIHPKYLRTTLQIWIIWLGIAFAYYGVILASAELLERDLVCGSAAPPLQDSSDDSEESRSPCHCHFFGPAAYQTMIISTAGEIALNPVNILSINLLGRRLSLCITMGCTALFFLLLNICTSSAGMVGFLFMLRALVSANFNTIYIYTAEVYPTTMRALGMGTSGALCRVGAMVAPFISQVLMSASFLGALCLFSSVCIICAISAVTLPIETKGRALQQVK